MPYPIQCGSLYIKFAQAKLCAQRLACVNLESVCQVVVLHLGDKDWGTHMHKCNLHVLSCKLAHGGVYHDT